MNNLNQILDVITNCAKLPEQVNDLGILKFAKAFFPNRFKNDFAYVHYKMIVLFLQLFNPDSKYDFERRRYLLIHRQAAKSTFASFLLPIYCIFLRGHKIRVYRSMLDWDFKDRRDIIADEIVEFTLDENFIVISSETATQAEQFVMSIKEEIETNNLLADYFGEKNPEILELDEERRKSNKLWRKNNFITKDRTIVYAIGAGQRVRGRNVFGYRPSLFIVDDMYSQHNTRTPETRAKFDYWFMAEAMNSVDASKGKMLWVGTMVHADTVVKSFRGSERWKGIEQSIIGPNDLNYCVKYLSQKTGRFELPKKEDLAILNKHVSTLSWADRIDLYSVLNKYYEELIANNLSYFYQEYMNIPYAPEMLMYRIEDFVELDFTFYIKDDRQYIKFNYDNKEWTGICELNVGIDPAASASKQSDDTAICVAGYVRAFPTEIGHDIQYFARQNPEGTVFPLIAWIEGGKYSTYNFELMPGIVERTTWTAESFKLNYVNLETTSQQINIYRELLKSFDKKGIRTPIYPDSHAGIKKENRISQIVSSIVQYHGKVLCNKRCSEKINILYNQLINLGNTDHDDYADSLAIAWKNINIPKEIPKQFILSERKNSSDFDRAELLKKEYGKDWWYYY